MKSSFKNESIFSSRWIFLGRILYGLRAQYRKYRVSKIFTGILGRQYKRSRRFIEIDITYHCNLRCLNCNRSCSQAPEEMHISLDRIRSFVDESIALKHYWERIRVLGGEPTLHPQFYDIVQCLLHYRKWNPDCLIEIVTNGYGKNVQTALERLPKDIWIENSKKTDRVQEDFGPFNLAPCDDLYRFQIDYRNGCAIMEECGMGLTPMGYYPCAISGGIDRIANWNVGYENIPDTEDDMLGLLEKSCSLCGRFRAGHFIPKNLRAKLSESMVSPTWAKLYENWYNRR